MVWIMMTFRLTVIVVSAIRETMLMVCLIVMVGGLAVIMVIAVTIPAL